MEDIEKLKKIGAKEISKHTHMALNKIQCILDSNFEGLHDRTTTIGLVKILEREYNVDLQKWQEEYNEFCNIHEQKTENLETVINFKITHEMTKQNNSKQYTILGAIAILLLGVGFYVYTNFANNLIPTKDSTTQKPTQTESLVAKDTTESQTESISEAENNATSNADTLSHTEPLPMNHSLDASASAPINELPQAPNAGQDSTPTTQVEPTKATAARKLEIIPRSNVWIGIVYLDTQKKDSLLTSAAVEIDLTRPQTIITGHGMLNLNLDGELTNYNKAEKMLFMVDEAGNFSEITLAQYNQHTRGLGW